MQKNLEFDLALEIINYTRKNVFLTGKAGTGKTTFLKYLVQNSSKNIIVTAPTGVAAINAGGVTLHSLFFLPFQAFVPALHPVDRNIAINKNELLRTLRISNQKKEVIEEMEILVIDEISMVRADLLDAINIILQYIRKNQLPFGGVQVVMIGDMYQLPPIIKNQEWEVLQNYYQSEYFFDAKALEENLPICIELKKVYRQTQESFISLLNNIRNHNLSTNEEELINNRYIEGFTTKEEGWITLSTHNATVNTLNQKFLTELQGKEYSFKAEIKGNFNEKFYPIDESIILKQCAQIMFIKNDSSQEKKYYNGKLAKIKSISNDTITVSFLDSLEDFVLQKETWRNLEYAVSKETGEIEEKELGTFKHYPIKLAWAITIHKSQGLTFNKVIIDMGRSFAPGQIYVAMSRCTSLEGIILISKIRTSQLFADKKIVDFQNNIAKLEVLKAIIESEKYPEAIQEIKVLLSLTLVSKAITKWHNEIITKKIPDKNKILKLHNSIENKYQELKKISNKFIVFLDKNYNSETNNWDIIEERTTKAIAFYIDEIENNILYPLETHEKEYNSKQKIKKYLIEFKKGKLLINKMLDKFYTFHLLGNKLHVNERKINQIQIDNSIEKEKKSTFLATFDLIQEKLSLQEIASLRNLTLETIQNHLCKLVLENKINDISPHITPNNLKTLIDYFEKNSIEQNLTEIKKKISENISFFEIKLIKNYLLSINALK